MPLLDPGASMAGEGRPKWLRTTNMLMLVATVGWLSGLRIRLIPPVEGTVIISESGQPLSQAVVHFRLPWKWGIAARTFYIPSPGGSVVSGGTIASECMTDAKGRFRLDPKWQSYWKWGKDYSPRFTFDYVHHPLYATERVSKAAMTGSSFWTDQIMISVARLSKIASRLAAGDREVYQRPWGSYLTQVSEQMQSAYYYFLPRVPGQSHKIRENTYRDIQEIEREWSLTAKALSMDLGLAERINQLEWAIQESGG